MPCIIKFNLWSRNVLKQLLAYWISDSAYRPPSGFFCKRFCGLARNILRQHCVTFQKTFARWGEYHFSDRVSLLLMLRSFLFVHSGRNTCIKIASKDGRFRYMQKWSRSPSEASFIKDSRKINHKKGLSLSWIGCLIGVNVLLQTMSLFTLLKREMHFYAWFVSANLSKLYPCGALLTLGKNSLTYPKWPLDRIRKWWFNFHE